MANATELWTEPVVLRAVREIRLQVSVVRVLLDEVDAVNPHDLAKAQLLEELARLGCRILETASALSLRED